MLKISPLCPAHTDDEPEIVPADPGNEFTLIEIFDAPPFPQLLVGITLSIPLTAEPEKSIVIEFVFAPETIDAPDGKLHVYPDASEAGEMVYTSPLCPGQTDVKPDIVPASAGNGSI